MTKKHCSSYYTLHTTIKKTSVAPTISMKHSSTWWVLWDELCRSLIIMESRFALHARNIGVVITKVSLNLT